MRSRPAQSERTAAVAKTYLYDFMMTQAELRRRHRRRLLP
jgi:hypothetical protein